MKKLIIILILLLLVGCNKVDITMGTTENKDITQNKVDDISNIKQDILVNNENDINGGTDSDTEDNIVFSDVWDEYDDYEMRDGYFALLQRDEERDYYIRLYDYSLDEIAYFNDMSYPYDGLGNRIENKIALSLLMRNPNYNNDGVHRYIITAGVYDIDKQGFIEKIEEDVQTINTSGNFFVFMDRYDSNQYKYVDSDGSMVIFCYYIICDKDGYIVGNFRAPKDSFLKEEKTVVMKSSDFNGKYKKVFGVLDEKFNLIVDYQDDFKYAMEMSEK